MSGPPYPWSARGALSSNTRGISWNRARYLTLVLSLALVLSLTLSLVELTLGSLARGGFLSRGSLPQPRMVGTQIWCPRRARLFSHKHLMLQILLALNAPLLTVTVLPNEGNLDNVAILPCSLLSEQLGLCIDFLIANWFVC